MRKEVILAIVAGGILGLVIAFGIWRANAALSPKGKGNDPKPTPVVSVGDFKITIAKPENNQVITETPTIISGITAANSFVVVSSEDADYIATSDGSGEFEIKTELNGGANQIRVASFDESGSSALAKLLLVYSSEFAKELESATPSATPSETNSSDSADSVRQKVQEKLKVVTSNPTSALGTITDLTDNTIQIKTQTGEIEQISLDKNDITFIKTTNNSVREVKFSDVAIGDFIVAMGSKNGNGILHAKRVLITDPLKETKREIVFGQATDLARLKLTLKNPKDGKSVSMEPDDQIKIIDLANPDNPTTRFSQIEEGDTIIGIGTTSENTFTARTVIVAKNGAKPTPTSKS